MHHRLIRRAAAAVLLLTGALVAPSVPSAVAQTVAAPVSGFVDGHSHLFSYEAFGGMLMCGKPYDPDGIEEALTDCPDHYPHGELAWFENFTRTGSPTGTHDPVGWPTFRDWPAHDSLTHQQAYYTWVERAWRGGLRVLVNDLVANRQLCAIYPLKKNSCDEMTSIRLQAQRARELQDHVDAEAGGPGRGWFRIVRDPAEARSVIAAGKLAVVLGIETSEPFGCRQIFGIPQCTKAQIDRGLDEMYALGVRSMFVCHKYDNALCGVRYDGGVAGAFVNLANFLGTGRFWQAETCTGPAHDNTIAPAGEVGDALQPILKLLGLAGITLPIYPSAPHCNVRGLSDLGAYMIQGMMKRHMIVEVDHMSAKAAGQALGLLEAARYPGVISSHSWMDATYLPRVYRLGGMVAGYGSAADRFTAEWRRNKAQRDPARPFGYGYGLDANGMGALPEPRTGGAAGPLQYPFTSPIDPAVKLDRLRTGQRTWDLGTEGVANYGLVPDWLADLRAVGGPEITEDMARGAETYLRMWRAAETAPS